VRPQAIALEMAISAVRKPQLVYNSCLHAKHDELSEGPFSITAM